MIEVLDIIKMKIKSKKFTYGHLTQGFPYEDTRHTKHHYRMMEGFQYLIHLPDGTQITGIFHKKGLGVITSKDNQYVAKSSYPQNFPKNEILLDRQDDDQMEMSLDKHSEVSCPSSPIVEQDKHHDESSFEITSQQSDVVNDLLSFESIQEFDNQHETQFQSNSTTRNQQIETSNKLKIESSESRVDATDSPDETNCSQVVENEEISEMVVAQCHVTLCHEILEGSNQQQSLDETNIINNQSNINTGCESLEQNFVKDKQHPFELKNNLNPCDFQQCKSLQEDTISSVESTTKNDSLLQQIDDPEINIDCSIDNKSKDDISKDDVSRDDVPKDDDPKDDDPKDDVSKDNISKDDVPRDDVATSEQINTENVDSSTLNSCKERMLEDGSDTIPSINNASFLQITSQEIQQTEEPVDCLKLVKDLKSEISLSKDICEETSSLEPIARTIPIQVACDEMDTTPQQVEMPLKSTVKDNADEDSTSFQIKMSQTLKDSPTLQVSSGLSATDLCERKDVEMSEQSSSVMTPSIIEPIQLATSKKSLISSQTDHTKQKSLISSQTDHTKQKVSFLTTPIRHSPYKRQSALNLPKMLFRLKGTSEKMKVITKGQAKIETSSISMDTKPLEEEIKDLKLLDMTPTSSGSLESIQPISSVTCNLQPSTTFITPKPKTPTLVPLMPSKGLTASVCTVAPTTSRITSKLVTPSPIQEKSPIFISPHFKALADICRQNTPKATALVAPNAHMKPTEEEVHILSSDDEDDSINQPSRQISRSEDNFLLRCPLRQAFFGTGRGGTFRVLYLSLEFIRLSNVSSTIHLDIPLKEVNKISVHHGLCGPVFFLKVSQEVRRLAEFHFSIGPFDFDPLGSDVGKSHVLLIPSKKNDVERDGLGHSSVTTSIEAVKKHVFEKFGHNLQVSVLNGGETSELIGVVLNAISQLGNRTPQTQASSIVTQTPPTLVTGISSRAGTNQSCPSTPQQLTPSFVIVGGNQPINILGSNNINITNNIFNINVSNNGPIRTNASTPNTQIIFLSKKLASLNTTVATASNEKTPQVRIRGPIMSLFTYPPTPGPGRMTITTEDYHCLNEGELLNDNIIDFYLKYFIEEHLDEATRNNVHLFSSFFYGKMVAEDRTQDASTSSSCIIPQQVRHSRVKTWTRHVDIFEKDFVIIPIIESSHWFLAIICFPGLRSPVIEHYQPNSGATNDSKEQGVRLKQSCILIFDSLGLVGHQTVTKTLRDYLQEEWNLKKLDKEGGREFSEQTFPGFNPSCPQQNNSTDCGVFVLKYVECFFKKPIKDFIMPISNTLDWFKHEVVREKRKQIQDLIMKLHNDDQQTQKNV